MLACTVAWDVGHAASAAGNGAGTSVGFSTLEAAVMDALAALDAVRPAAPPSAGAFKLHRAAPAASQHLPDEAGWQRLMEGTHAELAATAASQQAAVEAAASIHATDLSGSSSSSISGAALRVNPEAARQEYLLNGQDGLDDLLAAMDASQPEAAAAAAAADVNGVSKIVLARRTDIDLLGGGGSSTSSGSSAAAAGTGLDPLSLLEALQERDPRAYQLLLQVCMRMRAGDSGGALVRVSSGWTPPKHTHTLPLPPPCIVTTRRTLHTDALWRHLP